MTRWKASFIHLSISAIIAIAVLALMLLVWYPHPIFAAVGGQQVLMILLAVDVTLGPLITLTIFNPKKDRRTLSTDLSIVALLQISALIYGMSVVFQARPVYLAFSNDSFQVVTANMLSDEDMAKATNPEFRSLPFSGPQYVFIKEPANANEFNEMTLREVNDKSLLQLPEYYLPYASYKKTAGQAAMPLSELKRFNPERITDIDDAIHSSGRAESDIGFLPLRAKYQDQVVLVGKNDGTVLKMLEMNPVERK